MIRIYRKPKIVRWVILVDSYKELVEFLTEHRYAVITPKQSMYNNKRDPQYNPVDCDFILISSRTKINKDELAYVYVEKQPALSTEYVLCQSELPQPFSLATDYSIVM